MFILQGCKDKEDEEILPAVSTGILVAQSPSQVTLQGTIVTKGKYPVTDYGFIYAFAPDINEFRGDKVSLGKDAPTGAFSHELTGLSAISKNYTNPVLYARAFITNEKGTTLGQVVSVKLPNAMPQDISPNKGKAGDKITITGSFYTSNPSDIQVTFGNAPAKALEVSPSKIVVEVPTGVQFSNYSNRQVPVSIKIFDKTINVSPNFVVNPSLYGFTPNSGPIGTVVTIAGDNFAYNSYYGAARVFFGTQEATANTLNSSEIRATVPHNLTAKKVPVSVLIDGVTTVLPEEYTLTPHTITSISRESGLAGSLFTITGNGFPVTYPYSNSISVKLGDTPAAINYVTSNQITVVVPSGAYIGSHDVHVTIGPYTVTATQQFEVLAPTITGFSPASGGLGKEVTIYGTFQPGNSYTVYFGLIGVNSFSATANAIKVIVPASVPAGATQLAVQFGTQRIYTFEDFTVLEPLITSFTPGTGPAGTTVTIQVANFIPNYYTGVRFGTLGAQILSYNASSITAKVPTGITGPVKISVLFSGRTVISNDDFTVTE
ncbi:hypothetical protein GCM10027293_17690 [Pontibacter aydingkolensis]